MNVPPGEKSLGHIEDDQFLDLVSGLLQEAARERVIRHAATCPPCEARLREFTASHEQALARAAQVLAAPAAAPRPAWRGRPAPWLAAAAGLVAVAATVFLLRSQTGGPRGVAPAPAWLPVSVVDGERRDAGSSTAESLLVAGVQAYDHRDLATAERLLRAPREPGTLEWMRRLYLANTFVALGRDTEAIPLLEGQIAERLPEPWGGEWDWTFFVALERRGLHSRADSLLVLLEQRQDAIGDRARAMRHGRSSRR